MRRTENDETTAWGGVAGAPGAMPAEWVQRLISTPDALMALASAEAPRWADVVRRSGAKME
jgi:hypothetical protein